MIVNGTPYHNPSEYLFLDQKRKLGLVKRIQKQITKFDLSLDNFEFVNT
jgi:transposase